MGGEKPPETLYEFFNQLYPIAIKSGVSPMEYWNMTPSEIFVYTEAWANEQIELRKTACADIYNLACLVAKAFAGKLKSLYAEFPNLFENEYRDEQLRKFKAKMIEYSEANNAKRREQKHDK